eukprot:TRINITY_DN18395_c0_g1_i1.p1 TRINITY_DN18395_c0_g1~~TRINITY_DN18395_c0_g1_i1.p1  ORF type:complete len:420 (+),score=102.34 TRINITY_DN18395_c0_g1_i1:27-1286(+)
MRGTLVALSLLALWAHACACTQECYGGVHVTSASDLSVLEACDTVEGDVVFNVTGSMGVPKVNLPSLKLILGSLRVVTLHQAGVQELQMPALTSVSEAVIIDLGSESRDDELRVLDLSALQSVGDNLVVGNLKSLQTLRLNSLVHAIDIDMHNLPACSVTFPSLNQTTYLNLEAVGGASFPALERVEYKILLQSFSSGGVASFPVLYEVLSGILVRSVNALFPQLQEVQALALYQSPLQAFPVLESLSYLQVESSYGALSMPQLQHAVQIIIFEEGAIVSVDFSSLHTVTHMLTIDDSHVKELTFKSLQSVDNELNLQDLQVADLEVLSTLTNVGGLALEDLTLVTNLDGLRSLVLVTGDVSIDGCAITDITGITRDTFTVLGNVTINGAHLCCSAIEAFKAVARVSGTVSGNYCIQTC